MSLPRQYARTRRFTLGTPHDFAISPDRGSPAGGRVVFLRSRGGDDPATCLWVHELATGHERLIADPAVLLRDASGEVPPEERARRERMRELATGVTEYATDRAVRRAVFALSGRLWVADLGSGQMRELSAATPVLAPRPDPAGEAVAYVAGGSLRIIGADGSADHELAAPEGPAVSYGLPEYVAAESMGRHPGYWWSPDGTQILVARTDSGTVGRWYIADLSDPAGPPAEMAYPAVGTPNADVTLWVIGLDGGRVAVDWDRAGFEYVVGACWGREVVIVVQSRDQKTMRVLAADPRTGVTRVLREDTDPCWVQIVPGVPAFTDSGALVWTADSAQSRGLLVGDDLVTPPGLQVREVFSVDGDTVLFAASAEPAEIGLWAYSAAAGLRQITSQHGVHRGHRAGGNHSYRVGVA